MVLERDVIRLLVQKAKDRPMPGLLQQSSKLYKSLVPKIRSQILNSGRNLDPIEVELIVRKLASWMEDLVNEASNRSQRSKQASKPLPINSEQNIKFEQIFPYNVTSDNDKIMVKELRRDSDISTSFIRTDMKTPEQDGKIINDLIEGSISTKFIKKAQNTNQTLKVQQTSDLLEDNINSLQGFDKNLMKLIDQKRNSMSEKEWKDFVETKLLATNEKDKLEQIRNILEPILVSNKNMKRSTSGKTNMTAQSFELRRRVEEIENTYLRNKHRDLTPTFHNRLM